MSDLISRQEVIDALYDWSNHTMTDAEAWHLRQVIGDIKSMPSAEPERKKGEWIEQDDGWDGIYYECSECKEAFTLMDGTPTDNLYNFCPNCGADMRGEE